MANPAPLVLASGSPRRQQLLTDAAIDFTVAIPELDEEAVGQQVLDDGGTPSDFVTALALAKVNQGTGFTLDGLVLAADTIVVHVGRILGKPKNQNDARATILGMSGGTVEVLSAVALSDGQDQMVRLRTTTLSLRPLSPAEVNRYVTSGAADDKAGSLAVQAEAADFITNIDGCFTNVIGLPMCEVRDLLLLTEAGELNRRELEPHRASECLCPTVS